MKFFAGSLQCERTVVDPRGFVVFKSWNSRDIGCGVQFKVIALSKKKEFPGSLGRLDVNRFGVQNRGVRRRLGRV